jgi:hypothetical protein
MLGRAATIAGWKTILCPDAEQCLAAWEHTPLKLAWIDMRAPSAASGSGLREVCARLIKAPPLLVCVCGREDDPQEEIWARQLGVWLYLPDVTNSGELALLCEEALLFAIVD